MQLRGSSRTAPTCSDSNKLLLVGEWWCVLLVSTHISSMYDQLKVKCLMACLFLSSLGSKCNLDLLYRANLILFVKSEAESNQRASLLVCQFISWNAIQFSFVKHKNQLFRRMVFGGSCQETLYLGFMLLGTSQQSVPANLRELVLPDTF